MHFKPELEQLGRWRETNGILEDGVGGREIREETGRGEETEFPRRSERSERKEEKWLGQPPLLQESGVER
jgi:hypothetical protein